MSEPLPGRTWDGLEIALEEPIGSTVVVRRPAPGGVEILVLHRAAKGHDFEGDWAWTCPAGCRQPGEAVYRAALRELGEEAGIEFAAPWAVDLSGRWAVFALDVAEDTVIDLVDPEHDRYAWLTSQQAHARTLPGFVAVQQTRAASVPAVPVAFRPMTDADLGSVARWQAAPHARQWWDGAGGDEQALRLRYGPRLAGQDPTRMWVVEVDGRPVGFLQDYRVGDHPDYAAKTADPAAVGFDYLLGEPSLIGRGLGTRMIWEFCRDVLRRDYPDAAHFTASPSHRNHRSRRVLEKCGFTEGLWIDPPGTERGLGETEVVCTLDVRHWLG
ncbi:MAG: GNAT family N-acetyltransferase [Nocardioidaceae bacterium]